MTFTVEDGTWVDHVDSQAHTTDCGGTYEVRGSRIVFTTGPPLCPVEQLVFSGTWEPTPTASGSPTSSRPSSSTRPTGVCRGDGSADRTCRIAPDKARAALLVGLVLTGCTSGTADKGGGSGGRTDADPRLPGVTRPAGQPRRGLLRGAGASVSEGRIRVDDHMGRRRAERRGTRRPPSRSSTGRRISASSLPGPGTPSG